MNLIDKSNNHEDTYFIVSDEPSRIQRVSESSPDRGINDRRQQQQQPDQQTK